MSNSSEVNVKFIIDTAEEGIISDTHSLSPVVSASAPKPVPQQTSASSTCQTRRAAAQNPTSVNISRSHDFAPFLRHFPSGKPSNCTASSQTRQLPVAPIPPEVSNDLRTIPASELQRLLIVNHKSLIKNLTQIIDDPVGDRFVLDHIRKLLTARISGIEAAISWRSSFNPPARDLLPPEIESDLAVSTESHICPIPPLNGSESAVFGGELYVQPEEWPYYKYTRYGSVECGKQQLEYSGYPKG
ncbi:hypothetical protein RHS04_01079 [Rhizoctonia solani]|uniref:Uncharacterized protein n=1 Tax=Rhizoctonia solani TaxID=456999 RepID=A0A8H7HDW1_9AGAM|nr:hypothetical protein RHS04_01079 [Rhizoctonia solani]